MRAIFYTTLLFTLTFLSVSCVKKEAQEVADSPVIVHDVESDTPARSGDIADVESNNAGVRREVQNVKVVNEGDIQRLKKYSVVVATLTKQYGINALKKFFERDGIDYFVVKNPKGQYYFVISSSDSEEVAMKARADFLIKHTVDKSRKDIWEQYYIQLTDTFILEKE